MTNKTAPIISVKDVSMRFNLSTDKISGIKEYVVKALKRQLFYEEFWALKGVSFDVARGDVFGIVGLNGAGKSTLLKIISGVYKPTTGRVSVCGEIAPLLELGAGFDPEFSAKDNIFMNGAMFGHSPKYMRERYDDILNFAELWDFENVAVKNFSSGMKARLGFSVAINVEPDILIVDEILGVGDHIFHAKCEKRIQDMIDGGVTVLMVTHSLDKIQSMCSRAMLLKHGEVQLIGTADEVCAAYTGA